MKIKKNQAADLIGIHFKTLEDWIKLDHFNVTDPDKTGFEKTTSGRVFFDPVLLEVWKRHNLKPEQPEQPEQPEPIKAEPVNGIIKTPSAEKLAEYGLKPSDLERQHKAISAKLSKPARKAPAAPPDNFGNEFINAVLLPHKLILTVPEARKLTGLPLWYVRRWIVKVKGKNYIKKSNLEYMINGFFKLPE